MIYTTKTGKVSPMASSSNGLNCSNRYSTQLGLKNVDAKRLFNAFEKSSLSTISDKAHKHLRRPTSSNTSKRCTDRHRVRRVKSATVKRTTEEKPSSHKMLELTSWFPEQPQTSNSLVHCTSDVVKNKVLSIEVDQGYSAQPTSNLATVTSFNKSSHRIISSAEKRKSHKTPSMLQPLMPYATMVLPSCMTHPALHDSLVFLPGLSSVYSDDLPKLPQPHNPEEEYPYTHVIPDTHIHKPKKYTHPYYERMKKIKGWSCQHTGREVRINSHTGDVIHRYTISAHRNKNEIREEIVELERLIKGLSTDWGRSTVVLYQNEINDLQKMVKSTLNMVTPLESPPPTPDPTGLRKFCKEYDTALQALRDRHKQCLIELYKMEEMDSLYERAQKLAVT